MIDDLFPHESRRSLPIALLRAREATMQHFRPMLASHGLTEQQWRVLRILSETGELDATTLAERAFILMPSLSRILPLLEERGLVARFTAQTDRRRARIALSAAGQELIDAVLPDSRAIYAAIETRFGRDQVTALLELLDRLSAAADFSADAIRRAPDAEG